MEHDYNRNLGAREKVRCLAVPHSPFHGLANWFTKDAGEIDLVSHQDIPLLRNVWEFDLLLCVVEHAPILPEHPALPVIAQRRLVQVASPSSQAHSPGAWSTEKINRGLKFNFNYNATDIWWDDNILSTLSAKSIQKGIPALHWLHEEIWQADNTMRSSYNWHTWQWIEDQKHVLETVAAIIMQFEPLKGKINSFCFKLRGRGGGGGREREARDER